MGGTVNAQSPAVRGVQARVRPVRRVGWGVPGYAGIEMQLVVDPIENRSKPQGFRMVAIALFLNLPWMTGPITNGQALAGAEPVSFLRHVAPILVKNCLGCHDERKASGGLSMATFTPPARGGKDAGETILEPGKPEESFLIESVGPGAVRRMPEQVASLKNAEIAILTRWVKEGAKFEGPSVQAHRFHRSWTRWRDSPESR